MQNVRLCAAAITQARRDQLAPPSAHSCLVTVAAAPMAITCIICAFNEAGRINTLLDAVIVHPNVAETIVVNDGSTDGTEAILRRRTDISIVSYATNRGKTYALSRAVALAKYEHLMLLDADLAGISAQDIESLAAPVMSGRAEVSISLRANSLGVYRRIGLDFVTGERVVPTWLLRNTASAMERLPRWGAEAFINELIIAEGLHVAVVNWPTVFNVRKFKKVGWWRGIVEEIGMIRDVLRVLSPWGVIRQNVEMLNLATTSNGRPTPSGWRQRIMPSRSRRLLGLRRS
jgi:hypothetical protein